MTMKHPIPVDHPGVYIGEEIEARGWNQNDLAFVLGTRPQTVSLIVSGKRGVSAALAKSLADSFEVSPDLFLNLQRQYDLSRADDPDEGIQRRARVQQQYPLREMIRRGWIEDAEPKLLEAQVARFFEVADIADVPHIRHAAKKTKYDDILPQQLVWLFRVRQIAREMIVERYSKRALEDAIARLGTMLQYPEEIRHVPRILEKCGIRFVIVESLPGSGIDGVCSWLDKQSPVIGMTLRYDRIDNFWFVLRHEIEHVLNRDGLDEPMIDEELDPTATDLPELELKANAAGAYFCVPSKEMDSFYVRKNPYFSRSSIKAFAKRVQVHPGLVVGQLQFRMKKYAFLRDLQVKVRHHIVSSALVDGWGDVVSTDL